MKSIFILMKNRINGTRINSSFGLERTITPTKAHSRQLECVVTALSRAIRQVFHSLFSFKSLQE